jgi:hypothetical protein
MWASLFYGRPIGQHLFIPERGAALMVQELGDHILDQGMKINWAELEAKQAMRCLVEEAEKYVVRRKKDGVIVGEFFTMSEAQAIIDKAKASKKAALELVP